MAMVEADSLGDLLRKQASRLPDKAALMAPEKSGFREISYREMFEEVRRYAGALRQLALSKGDKLAILSENCVEWAYLDWACSSLGIVTVPVYPSLPSDQAQYIVCDSDSVLAVAGSEELLAKVKPLDNLRSMLIKGAGSIDEMSKASTLTSEEFDSLIDSTKLDDVFTIIYTSGTTGQPKGAMLQHRGALHVCRTAMAALRLDEHDLFLSFLPMSHVYERIAGQILPIAMGATIAYAKSLASLVGDMQRVRPTIMLCVPRFLESFRDRAMDSIAKEKPFKRKLVELAMSQSLKRSKGQFAPLAAVLDKLVLEKIRARTGGKLRFFVSGGAALPPYVADFLASINLMVLQGYGLTETSGGTCINHPDRNRPWTVGEPLDMEIKFAEDGEILVRGPARMVGYYNLPEDTAAAIDEEGYFHTGDIGKFDGNSLMITDRKKDLIVLGNGKNVAPQPIENKLKSSLFIEEAVVFGDSMDHCVALIVPKTDAVRRELGLGDGVKLSESKEAKQLIKREIDGINKTVAPFEMVKKHAILDHSFSIDTGELTPSMKVKRKVVREKYADVLRQLA